MTQKTKLFHFLVLFTTIFLHAEHALSTELKDVFSRVNPAVVVIKTLSVHDVAVSLKKDDFVKVKGLGSGVLISQDGNILTAAHVVHAADKIMVEFLDGQQIQAMVVTSAQWADIALLKLVRPPRNIEPLTLANSDTVQVGEKVFVIGAPYGLSHSLSVGYISARVNDTVLAHNMTEVELLQTDAAINSGNSGGPLFNMAGEVIGIVSHIKSRSGGFEGLGFAVSANVAKEIMKESFWSGVEGYFLKDKLAHVFNLPQDAGLLVQHVAEGSMGSVLGLKSSSVPVKIGKEKFLAGGDVILEFAGIKIENSPETFEKIRAIIRKLKQDDTVELVVFRNGERLTITQWGNKGE